MMVVLGDCRVVRRLSCTISPDRPTREDLPDNWKGKEEGATPDTERFLNAERWGTMFIERLRCRKVANMKPTLLVLLNAGTAGGWTGGSWRS